MFAVLSAHAQPRKDRRVPSSIAAAHATKALRAAGLDAAHSAVWIGSLDGKPTLSHRATVALNPASVMKVVTTSAALRLLGPSHVWHTRVDVAGVVNPATRTLTGQLIIRGGGDPKLVVERLEPLLQSVRDQGIDSVVGDIVLDRRAFTVPERDPGDFDGEPLRPYNARPDPLLINFKAIVLNFKPDPTANVAEVSFEPPLAGVSVPTSVPLSKTGCGDWRGALQADFSDPNVVKLAGSYPTSCGERPWPVAYADAPSHSARAIAAMWAKVGGSLSGSVVNAPNAAPVLTQPSKEWVKFASLPLSDVMRDINKYSNNVMAQHVFLTLATAAASPKRVATEPITLGDARRAATLWWEGTLPGTPAPTFDNGSGLSRSERIAPASLAKLLANIHASPEGPLLFDSLPNAGVDGTLSSLRGSSMQGRASLKTGSLKDATALAGSFVSASGDTRLFVALYNGTEPAKARTAMYCLLQQAAFGGDRPAEGRNLCRK